jgi:hypothetical protein
MKLTLTALNLARLRVLAQLSLAVAMILATTLPFKAIAASKATGERWFEIEVILFHQLDDKSTAKEQFPPLADLAPLPRYKKVRDLLTPYLYPDISTLKQQLPQCNADRYPENLVQQRNKLAEIHPLKTLVQIKQSRSTYSLYDDDFSQEENKEEAFTETYSFNRKSALDIAENEDSFSGQNNAKIFDSQGNQLFEETFIPKITPEQLALVNEAEQNFSPVKFNYHQGVTFLTNKQGLCRISTNTSGRLNANASDFSFADQATYDKQSSTDSFPVDKVAKTINGIEKLFSKKPYLINNDSLQLHNIVRTLKRTKNFRPLLHMGWREAPLGRRKAIPIRIFAGDNLALQHKKDLTAYQKALAKDIEQERALATIYNTADYGEPDINKDQHQQQLQLQLQQRVEHIFSQIEAIPEDAQAVIATLDAPELALTIPADDKIPLMLTEPPTAPVQPWSVDGFFKVHLNHYLYITADFNIMNMNLAEKASQALRLSTLDEQLTEQALAGEKDYKPIRFQQNRRVISGEVHYFDHPYIGMIVQIRKHKRPQPPTEDESGEENSDDKTES